MIHDKEHDRLLKLKSDLVNTYAGHQTWSAADRASLKRYNQRLAELKKILNIQY